MFAFFYVLFTYFHPFKVKFSNSFTCLRLVLSHAFHHNYTHNALNLSLEKYFIFFEEPLLKLGTLTLGSIFMKIVHTAFGHIYAVKSVMQCYMRIFTFFFFSGKIQIISMHNSTETSMINRKALVAINICENFLGTYHGHFSSLFHK